MNTQMPFTDQKPIFMKMAEVASYPNMTTEQQRIYMDSLNNYRTVMAAKEYDFQRGVKEGMEKGMVEKAMNIALSMQQGGMPADLILKYTGIDVNNLA